MQVFFPFIPEPTQHTYLKSLPGNLFYTCSMTFCFGFTLQSSDMHLWLPWPWLCFASWILPPGFHKEGSTQQSAIDLVLGAPYLCRTLTVLIFLAFSSGWPPVELNKIKMSEGCEWPRKPCQKGSHLTWTGKDAVRFEK